MDGSKSRLEPYDYHGGLAPMDNDNFNMEPLNIAIYSSAENRLRNPLKRDKGGSMLNL